MFFIKWYLESYNNEKKICKKRITIKTEEGESERETTASILYWKICPKLSIPKKKLLNLTLT